MNFYAKTKNKRKKDTLPPLTEVEEIDLVRKGSKFHMIQDTLYLVECNKALDKVKGILTARDDIETINQHKKTQKKLLKSSLFGKKEIKSVCLDDTEHLVDELLEILAEDLELIDTETPSDLSTVTPYYDIGDRIRTTEFFNLKEANSHKSVPKDTILQVTEISPDGCLRVQVDDDHSCQFFLPLWLPPLHLNKIKKIKNHNIILVTGWDTFEDDNFTILYNGFYILQPIPHEGKPWYRMENSLRHIKWNTFDKCWYFLNGRINNGNDQANARCEDKVTSPIEIQNSWKVYIGGEWIPQNGIKIYGKFYCPNRRSFINGDYKNLLNN